MTFRTFPHISKETKIINYIADNLSAQNKHEADLLFPGLPLPVLIQNQTDNTEQGFVIYNKNGDPCGIGGIDKTATIWFIVTENAAKDLCMSWFKQGKKWLAEQIQHYRVIDGYVNENNILSKQWMKDVGFDIAPTNSAATINIGGENFQYFMKIK